MCVIWWVWAWERVLLCAVQCTLEHGKLANYIALRLRLWHTRSYLSHLDYTFVRLIYDFYLLLFPISSLLFFGLFVACSGSCSLTISRSPFPHLFIFQGHIGCSMPKRARERLPNFSRYWCYFNKRLNIFIIWMCVTMIHEYPIAFA